MTQFVLYLGLKLNGNNLVAILSKLYLTVRGIIISILQPIGQFQHAYPLRTGGWTDSDCRTDLFKQNKTNT